MTSIAEGHRAGFDITIWKCDTCDRYEATNRRVDGNTYWVEAIGRAVIEESDRLIAVHKDAAANG
jgi:hypothetical protein